MVKIGKRDASLVLKSVFDGRHYGAFWSMMRFSSPFLDTFKRYLLGGGQYPCQIQVKTPTGPISPTIYSYYDLLTLNEIFFRDDYATDPDDKIILDIGSNIGLSALYFLTRNPNAHVTLFEPDKKNIERLKKNIEPFQQRTQLQECAVYNQNGTMDFGVDYNSGRYGGLTNDFGVKVKVQVRHINDVLKEILDDHSEIDLLKIDTEGAEIDTFKAINPDFLPKIKKIYMECTPKEDLSSGIFTQIQRGTVCILRKKRTEK